VCASGLANFARFLSYSRARLSFVGTKTVQAAEKARSAARLDERQRAVVDHAAGPLVAFGGPGTGKTTVLEERFLRLATLPGSSPDRILFLVPNRAQKMALQDRLTRRLLGSSLRALVEVPVYTWHGFAHHLVSRHYDRLAYSEPPVLLTSPEQWGDVKEVLASPGQDLKWSKPYRHLLDNRGFIDEIVDFCIRAEQRLLEPYELEQIVRARPAWADVIRFFKTHSANLRQRSRIDYPTLLADAAELIANHDDLREALHRRFTHVVVDDGQELARVQQRLLRFLTGFIDAPETAEGRSLVVAADPDSAIETFRGAEPDWLNGFEKDFGSHQTVTLDTSYRLGADVGGPAVAFVSRNGESQHRPSSFAGETALDVTRYQNLAAEVQAVARTFRLAHLVDGVAYEDMAILLTSPRQMLPALERALGEVEVPYSIAAPDRPLEREPAVRSFVALAEWVFGRATSPDDLVELLRSPIVGLGIQEVRELERVARSHGDELAGVVANPPPEVEASVTAKLAELVRLRDAVLAEREQTADRAFWTVWTKASYYRELEETARGGRHAAANRDLDALVAFSRSLGRFVERRRGGKLEEYLDAVGRADFGSDPWLPPERRAGGVEVLSFHAAKGREWDLVAVCGCVEGSIPKGRRAQGLFDPYFLDGLTARDRYERNDAEDRRVFYVALTRARRRCLVTTSPGPTRKGQPTRFIAELIGEIPDVTLPEERHPVTFSEAAARYRRVLSDPSRDAVERIVALQAIARICALEPGCTAARPAEWWWRWDWTEGVTSINAQRPESSVQVPPDRLRTSYSRISEYDNCGLRYLFKVVLGFEPETSHNMAFGTWIHRIFEECDRLVITTKADALARFEQLFDGSVFPNKAIARQFRHDGKVMIERYVRHLKPGHAIPGLVEKEFAIDFDGNLITGRIDRVDKFGNGVNVTDYKTSRSPIWYSEAEQSLQLAIYYLAAKNDAEIAQHGPPLGMRLVYPGHLSRGEPSVRAQNPAQAEAALERLPRLVEGVLTEDFRPNPEADCTWCRFKPLCPLWPEGKELPA
jgi:superfamily I DNA/RNA helicase